MSSSTPSSIPGYDFDPIKGRYFKRPVGISTKASGLSKAEDQRKPSKTRGKASTKRTQDQYVVRRSERPSPCARFQAHLPAFMSMVSELHPGTSASRSSYQSKYVHSLEKRTSCSWLSLHKLRSTLGRRILTRLKLQGRVRVVSSVIKATNQITVPRGSTTPLQPT